MTETTFAPRLADVLITRAMVMVPLYLCGFSEGALNAYVILVGVQAVAIHANLGINFGPLRYVIATPQFHHWHHSKDRQYMDANYAVHLPIIDMLFGTYKCPKGEWPKEYGIVSGNPPPLVLAIHSGSVVQRSWRNSSQSVS